MDTYNTDFWKTLDELVKQLKIVIDRPKIIFTVLTT